MEVEFFQAGLIKNSEQLSPGLAIKFLATALHAYIGTIFSAMARDGYALL